MTTGRGDLRRMSPGQSPFDGPLDSQQYNQIVQTVRAMRQSRTRGIMQPGGGLSARIFTKAGAGAVGIVLRDSASQSDYTDNRYWIKVWTDRATPATLGAYAKKDAIADLSADGCAYSDEVTATNLAEKKYADDTGDGCHRLTEGTVVLCWQIIVDGEHHWVFWHPTEDRIPAQITGGNGSGAHSWVEVVMSSSGTYTRRSDGNERSGTDNAYEFNNRQRVPDGTIVWIDLIWHFAGNTEGYWFDLAMGSDVFGTSTAGMVTRKDITYTGEHQEEARGSDHAWDIDEQTGSERGVKFTVQTGEAYYEDGDQTLYCYVVDLEFDANGHLFTISDERRVVVDVPETCDIGTTA